MKLNPKVDEKTRKAMEEKLPAGTDVIVDGKRGKVDGYALHSKLYFVTVGGVREKLPLAKISRA